GADLGIILLLLMLGLEYGARELVVNLRSGAPAGLFDLVINFGVGFVAGLVLGFGPIYSLFLGGVIYISSSGVIAKTLDDLGWLANRETPVVLSILVFEDLAMAVILPILGALAIGGTMMSVVGSVTAALVVVALILAVAASHGDRLSDFFFSTSDEVNLLSVLGLTLVVAGAAEQVHISAAVGAFLVGIGISGQAAHQARNFLQPLRDLFAAVFFVFFGLSIDPRTLGAVAVPVLILAIITGGSKVITGWWAARRAGIGTRGGRRAGALLIARGEFSIVIAGLGVTAGAGSELASISAGYVLVMATVGPIAARLISRAPRPTPTHS
ncbi:MAG TPA: cation:proton antiporter, partial [Acidimicrobiia bacterium]|nr:cation:proton antiporter [Acidimicrobiia bacterium]